MSLVVEVTDVARGLDARFLIAPGRRLALAGPNGAGKSSLLAAISGSFRPASARVRLHDRMLLDTAAPGSPIEVPPHQRGVALLSQDPLLFPHLTVLDNVAFAPRSAGLSRAEARRAAEHWLDQTEAAHLRALRPHELSGGQAQRVSIARALAAQPLLLLLDEPFSATDVAAVPTLRELLDRVLRDRMAIIVSHALNDIVGLADDVVVIDGGRVIDEGPVAEVLSAPRSGFLRALAASSLVRGTRTESGIRLDGGAELPGRAAAGVAVGERAFARFGPNGLTVFPDDAAVTVGAP